MCSGWVWTPVGGVGYVGHDVSPRKNLERFSTVRFMDWTHANSESWQSEGRAANQPLRTV